MQAVAAKGGSELSAFYVASSADYPTAFAAMRAARAEALVIAGARELSSDGRALARLALEAGLPTVCEWPYMAAQGCLLGYGPSLDAMRRHAGGYVARIFKGAAPGELPIEYPSRIEFTVNLKIARDLGIEVPVGVLVRADQVIE